MKSSHGDAFRMKGRFHMVVLLLNQSGLPWSDLLEWQQYHRKNKYVLFSSTALK